MKKLVLSLMMGALALSSMEAQAYYSPRSDLQGSYNRLVNNVYPTNEYERLCKQRLMQLVPRIISGSNANMTLPVTKGNTALHYAMSLGYKDLISDLLECGADPYCRNHKGKTPIDCIGNDYDGSIQRMVNNYGRPSTPSYSGGSSVRQRLSGCLATVRNMHPSNETMRLYCTRLNTLLPIIINGGDANTTLPITKGNTALHYACGLGYYELVQVLLEAGASPRLRTHKGASPSDCASGANAARIRNLLNMY